MHVGGGQAVSYRSTDVPGLATALVLIGGLQLNTGTLELPKRNHRGTD